MYEVTTILIVVAARTEAVDKPRIIKKVVNHFLHKRWNKIEEMTADDAFVYIQGPRTLPYAGRYTGKQCVRDAFVALSESFTIVAVPEVYYYVNENGSEFVAFDFGLQAVTDDRVKIETSVAMKVKVNDAGQLVKVAVISDTLSASEALDRAAGVA
jgi:hypothetical protein